MKNIFKKKRYITKEDFKLYKDDMGKRISELSKDIGRLERILRHATFTPDFEIKTDYLTRFVLLGYNDSGVKSELLLYVNGDEHRIKLNECVPPPIEDTKRIAVSDNLVIVEFDGDDKSDTRYKFTVDIKNGSYIDCSEEKKEVKESED